jgi:hypothetical protein
MNSEVSEAEPLSRVLVVCCSRFEVKVVFLKYLASYQYFPCVCQNQIILFPLENDNYVF